MIQYKNLTQTQKCQAIQKKRQDTTSSRKHISNINKEQIPTAANTLTKAISLFPINQIHVTPVNMNDLIQHPCLILLKNSLLMGRSIYNHDKAWRRCDPSHKVYTV